MLCFLGTTVAVEGGDILHHMLCKLRAPLVQTLQVGFDPCSPLLDHLVVLRALLSPHVLPRITELLGNLPLVFHGVALVFGLLVLRRCRFSPIFCPLAVMCGCHGSPSSRTIPH